MQTLRKKNSPCKIKNEPTRFLGEGVSFKAKLIGILEVSEARGDRMCQAALADLKMAIRAAGEHKQRITVQISIDGLRLRDEKNGDCLYHHPVHKISFIAQDMSDSRAFGYIFGSPDTGHRFFGIKTDKAASQVVIAMRDLFQVVFELKKKEIELAKQHIEHNVIRYSVERSPDTKGAAGSETSLHRTASESDRSRKHEPQTGVVADLLDLQFELNSLRQGIHQMDKITPDNPRPSEDPFVEADPFGDSFANMKIKEEIKPILPPPPSSSKRSHIERQQTIQQTPTSGTSSPANIVNNKTPPPQGTNQNQWFDKEAEELFNEGESSSNANRKNSSSDEDKEITSSSSQQDRYKPLDIFSELDPLGVGIKKPYVDKKDFFQNLKNPPKKVLKDLASTNSEDTFPTNFNITSEATENNKQLNESISSQFEEGEFADFDKFKEKDISTSESKISPKKLNNDSNKRTVTRQSLSVSCPPEETSSFKNSYGYMSTSMSSSRYESTKDLDSTQSLVKLPSPKKYLHSRKTDYSSEYSGNKSQSIDRSFPVDFSSTSESPASPLRSCSSGANSRLSSSSAEMENVPEPPPRGAGSILINPPPLPPKKHSNRSGIKPPPRPPYGEGHFHYDFLEKEEGSPSPTRRVQGTGSPMNIKDRFDDNFSPPLPQLPKRSDTSSSFSHSSFEDSFSSVIQSPKTMMETSSSNKHEINWANITKDFTVSQLNSTLFTDLAEILGMSVAEVASLTLQQLAEYIQTPAKKESLPENKETSEKPSNVKKVDNNSLNSQAQSTKFESSFVSNEPLFKATFDQDTVEENTNPSTYDKYAVFRELLEMEQANNDLKTQKSSEEEERTSENAEETADIEDDAQSDDVEENNLNNLTVENQSKEISSYYEMKSSSENIESPRDNDMTPQEEIASQEPYYELDSLNKDESYPDLTITQNDKLEKDNEDINEETKESSDNFIITAEEVNELSRIDKKSETKTSISSTSSDKYAALREIIGEAEGSPMNNDNFIASPNKNSVASSVEVDLHGLFTDNFAQSATIITTTTKIIAKKDEDAKTNVMDIFEEIKMLNSDAHRSKETNSTPSNLETIFNAFSDSKPEKEDLKEGENWAKFESNLFQSDKSSGDGQGSVSGTSPWSPESKELNREPSIKRNIQRHSGESDNEWKDDESEESNGKSKGEGLCCVARHGPRYDVPPFEGRFYDDPAESDKERIYREKMSRKTRGTTWMKSGHRGREPSPWHEDPRWEEERRRQMHRKMPYKDEEESKAYWKCRPKQRPWNGDREGFWGPDHPYYEEECKRRMALWTEEERDRFSSQESMGYDDEERWYRREYDRRRMEEDSMYWRTRGPEGEYLPREPYKKHDPHYFREGRDRHYDYPPSWEEEYGPKHSEDSPRYLTRKKHWPKRPNSANEGRDLMYMDMRPKCAMTRSECSDNDSDPYHRPHRSRSRESYWSSDQEFESWGERPYYSEGPDAKNESLHRKRMNRHRARPQPKPQSSQFEDDFTQSVDHGEIPIETVAAEPRIRPEIEMKQPVSPRSPRGAKDHGRREGKPYKSSSSYFDDDLTPTASASSDASDRQRIGSDLKVTPEELPIDAKEPTADGFASEDSGRDSFFNGDPRFDDDAFAFRSELEDQVPECAAVPNKNSRLRYTNSRGKGDQYVKKSDSVNIFSRENDPFDDDEFFN